jgi:hypothetical protein
METDWGRNCQLLGCEHCRLIQLFLCLLNRRDRLIDLRLRRLDIYRTDFRNAIKGRGCGSPGMRS